MSNDSISTKLQELFELFKSGSITKEEFESLKSELINTSIKQAPESIDENKEPTKTNLPKSSGEEISLNKDKEVEEVNSIKTEEKTPDSISKPKGVKNKKNKSIAVYLFIIVVVIIVLSVGLNLFLRQMSVQAVEEKSYDNVVFGYEVYDTNTDKNAPYIYVRQIPDSKSAYTFKLQDGDRVAVLESGIGDNNNWLKIKSQTKSRIGYVHERHIREIDKSLHENQSVRSKENVSLSGISYTEAKEMTNAILKEKYRKEYLDVFGDEPNYSSLFCDTLLIIDLNKNNLPDILASYGGESILYGNTPLTGWIVLINNGNGFDEIPNSIHYRFRLEQFKNDILSGYMYNDSFNEIKILYKIKYGQPVNFEKIVNSNKN